VCGAVAAVLLILWLRVGKDQKEFVLHSSPNSALLFMNCFIQASLAAVRLVVWADLPRLLRRHIQSRLLNVHLSAPK
jgi:hypothetical protein